MTINEMVRACDVMVPFISDGFAVLRTGDRTNNSRDFNIGKSWTLREIQVASLGYRAMPGMRALVGHSLYMYFGVH